MLANYLNRVELFMSCKFIEYLSNWLFLLDVLKNEVIIKYQDQPNEGFDKLNEKNWVRYLNVIKPLMKNARVVTALWYGTFKQLTKTLPLPTLDDQPYLTQATLTLNLFVNDSIVPVMIDTDNHQKCLKVIMIRATIQDILYHYSKNHCVLAIDEWNPRSGNQSSIKKNSKDIIPTKMLRIVAKLESFAKRIHFISEKEANSYYMPHVIFTYEILNPDKFVVYNKSVRWLWNDARIYPYEAYEDLKTEFHGLLFDQYKKLSVFTVLVTFYEYLADYLKIYFTHVMTPDTTFFGDQDEPNNYFKVVRIWFYELSNQIGRVKYTNSLVEIHHQLNDFHYAYNRMSVQYLLLILQTQLNALNLMVDFTGSPYKINVTKKDAAVNILKMLHNNIENYIHLKITNTDFSLLKTISKYT